MKKKTITMIAGFSILGLVLICALLTFFVPVKGKRTVVQLELGSTLPEKPADYYRAFPLTLLFGEVDTEGINPNEVGLYEVTYSVFGKKYSTTVQVVDTTTPAVTLRTEAATVELCEELTVDYFVEAVTDAAGECKVSFRSGLEYSDTYSFNNLGPDKIIVEVTDINGNRTIVRPRFQVVDTTAPEIYTLQTENYYARGRTYEVEDFCELVTDASGVCEVWLDAGGERGTDITFAENGEQEVTLVAQDSSGNQTTLVHKVMVGEAPVLIVHDRVLVTGTPDVLDVVVAIDPEDGNLTDLYTWECDRLYDLETPGDYIFTISVTDSTGITTSEDMHITLVEDSSLATDEYFTTQDLELMCEYHFFEYEPLEQADHDAAVELVKPAQICLFKGDDNSWTSGSGFIYEITPEYIYIGSVNHVTKAMLSDCQIYFWNDTRIVETISPVKVSDSNELVMFRVPIEEVPAGTLVTLRSVYADENVYDELTVGDDLIGYVENWKKTTVVVADITLKAFDKEFMGMAQHCIETSYGTKSGMSGGTVIDLYGRLVGVVEGRKMYYEDPAENGAYHARIDDLDELYERVVNGE